VEGSAFTFEEGDEFLCRVTGVDIGVGYQDNSVQMARDILINYGGVTLGDFSSNWDTLFGYRMKSKP
jgi:hypothetical protein